MENDLIKLGLSYDLASDLHEEWRNTRLKDDGTYEERWKESTDEEWNNIHGTNKVDIANTSFKDLPANYKQENLEAAKVVIELTYDKIVNSEELSIESFEEMASIVHDKWLERNSWAYESSPELAVPYQELSEEEKDKDRIQLRQAIEKVSKYLSGIINIDDIINEYNLSNGRQK